MKLKYDCLVFTNVNQITALYHFITDYADAKGVQIDFRKNEIEIFDEDGHLVSERKFDELFD